MWNEFNFEGQNRTKSNRTTRSDKLLTDNTHTHTQIVYQCVQIYTKNYDYYARSLFAYETGFVQNMYVENKTNGKYFLFILESFTIFNFVLKHLSANHQPEEEEEKEENKSLNECKQTKDIIHWISFGRFTRIHTPTVVTQQYNTQKKVFHKIHMWWLNDWVIFIWEDFLLSNILAINLKHKCCVRS